MEHAEGLRAATCDLFTPEIACASCSPFAQAQASTSADPEEPRMGFFHIVSHIRRIIEVGLRFLFKKLRATFMQRGGAGDGPYSS